MGSMRRVGIASEMERIRWFHRACTAAILGSTMLWTASPIILVGTWGIYWTLVSLAFFLVTGRSTYWPVSSCGESIAPSTDRIFRYSKFGRADRGNVTHWKMVSAAAWMG